MWIQQRQTLKEIALNYFVVTGINESDIDSVNSKCDEEPEVCLPYNSSELQF